MTGIAGEMVRKQHERGLLGREKIRRNSAECIHTLF